MVRSTLIASAPYRAGAVVIYVLTMLSYAAAGHAQSKYTALIFYPLTPNNNCNASSAPTGMPCSGFSSGSSSTSEANGFRTQWRDEANLADIMGRTVTATDFGQVPFVEGSFFVIDTDLMPPINSGSAPDFSAVRNFPIGVHWEAVRAWVNLAAQSVDHLVIVGHSFSGPAVINALLSVAPSVAEKIDVVLTVAAPNGGVSIPLNCSLYSTASCDLAPQSAAMINLRNRALGGVLNPQRELGRKLVSVVSEAYTPSLFGPYFWGSDGTIPIASQLFLADNTAILRNRMGETTELSAYWAVFFETSPRLWPDGNHIAVNQGPAMVNAINFIDNRMYGSPTYCEHHGPCDESEGDCDENQAECAEGLNCARNVGPEFGLSATTDVCVANGHSGFCTPERCLTGEGDCDNSAECFGPNSRCIHNIGEDYGFSSSTDVCEPNGHRNFCRHEQCGIGEGDCDRHSDCTGTNVRCVNDVGPQYGFSPTTDVCEVVQPGDADYCSPEIPCGVGERGCANSNECAGNLQCQYFTNQPSMCL